MKLGYNMRIVIYKKCSRQNACRQKGIGIHTVVLPEPKQPYAHSGQTDNPKGYVKNGSTVQEWCFLHTLIFIKGC
jgi:hypothetical protein